MLAGAPPTPVAESSCLGRPDPSRSPSLHILSNPSDAAQSVSSRGMRLVKNNHLPVSPIAKWGKSANPRRRSSSRPQHILDSEEAWVEAAFRGSKLLLLSREIVGMGREINLAKVSTKVVDLEINGCETSAVAQA
uniref:Uncharacterized protein n=1 Tax=Leersia perrieri TaxID=77586 RepID=A0A0D9VCD7_9ORYZ